MSAISVLQTPPCSPRRLEKEDTTSSEFHQKTDDTQQEKTEVLQTPPPTPRYDDDIEFHATEKDASTNDTADCQADPSLGCTEELKVPHANAQVEGLEVSLNSPSTLSSHGGSKDNTEDVVSAVSTGNAQDERTIVMEKEDNPDSTRVTAEHTTRTEDAKESFTSEPARQSEKDEQKDTDHVASAGEFTNRLSKNPEQVEEAKVEILPPKVEAKETSLSIPVTATQVISSALVQQQPEQLIRVIKPGEVSACIDNFVRKVEEITSSYGQFITQSIFHTIHEHLSNFKNATVFSRDDEKTLRPFATGYVYFTIYTPGSFQYYDEGCTYMRRYSLKCC
ncbi:hypothetical protein BGZ74_003814 [Mortierella antarctica]|nr:hypothetical protein BGZ74_003814 [Mortierella antarctica]